MSKKLSYPKKNLYTDRKLLKNNTFYPDEPARIHERNAVEPLEFDYKPINKIVYHTSAYKFNFNRINTNDPFG